MHSSNRVRDLSVEQAQQLNLEGADRIIAVKRGRRYRQHVAPSKSVSRARSEREKIEFSRLIRELHTELRLLNADIESFSW
jgi:hypothetical protein